MPVSRIARFLVGALLVCGSVLAAEPAKPVVVTNTPTNPVPTTAQGTTQVSGSVGVTNTAANPVPTTAQGTTHISGAVDVLSAPPVTGSVAVSNQPTVNLAPGSTVAVSGTVNVASQPPVRLAPGTSVGIAGTPTVGLAPGSSVAVSSLPAVQIGGTPTVVVANQPGAPTPYRQVLDGSESSIATLEFRGTAGAHACGDVHIWHLDLRRLDHERAVRGRARFGRGAGDPVPSLRRRHDGASELLGLRRDVQQVGHHAGIPADAIAGMLRRSREP